MSKYFIKYVVLIMIPLSLGKILDGWFVVIWNYQYYSSNTATVGENTANMNIIIIT